jgi:anti-anti-sigma regulatory factor
MLRIEKRSEGHAVLLQISGRIQSEQLHALRQQIESCRRKTVLNLDEVQLVDRSVVRFLGDCESNGIELVDCPLYIREWILGEKRRERR